MHALSREDQPLYQCIEEPEYEDYVKHGGPQGCGKPYTSQVFFISFVVIISLVFLNLFVAIILEGFDDIQRKDKRKVFDQSTTETFRDIWSSYDPFATGFIRVQDFQRFMLKLGESSNIGWPATVKENHVYQEVFTNTL